MRISRLRLHNFRGWDVLDLRPREHVLLTGVPRGGRSDIIAALIRLLDPLSVRVHPVIGDIRQFRSGIAAGGDENTESDTATPTDDETTNRVADVEEPVADAGTAATTRRAPFAEVEATLIDLDPDLEQLCDGFLEPIDSEGQIDESGSAAPDASLGVRLAYRVTYDAQTDVLEHVVFFPVRSRPETSQFARVPSVVRRALPVVVLNTAKPLQLRAEGTLRRLVTERDPDAAATAFRTLESSIAAATSALSIDGTISKTVEAVLEAGGVARRLSDFPLTSANVLFQAEDGSLSALLRAVQPALTLDDAGLLSLTNHGSTAATVLAVAEALLVVSAASGAVVVGDDFGDGLDAANTEYLAGVLRHGASQAWLASRRPEAARAFAPEELVRVSRHGGVRDHHVLSPPTDRKEVAVRRLLHTQLLPALTAPVVAITEGPHDLTTYSAVDRRRTPPGLPLSAFGVRLISADNGSGGGTSQVPRVADLARALGFRVVAIIDCDPAKNAATTLPPIEAACDVVVRLPAGMALEQAIIAGVEIVSLRAASSALPIFGVGDPTVGESDANVGSAIAQVLHRKGLHEQFLDALIETAGLPPVITATLDAVAKASDPHYSGPNLVDIAWLAPPVATSGAP